MALLIHKLIALFFLWSVVDAQCDIINFMSNPSCEDPIINKDLIHFRYFSSDPCKILFWHELKGIPSFRVLDDDVFYTVLKTDLMETSATVVRVQNSFNTRIDSEIKMPQAGEVHVIFYVKVKEADYKLFSLNILLNDPYNNWVQMVCYQTEAQVQMFMFRSHYSAHYSPPITCNATKFHFCSQSLFNHLFVSGTAVSCRQNITELDLSTTKNPFSLNDVGFVNYSAVLFEVNAKKECRLVWWANGAGGEIIHQYNGIMNQNSQQHNMSFFLLDLESETVQYWVNRHLGAFFDCERFFAQEMRCAPIKYQLFFYIHLNFKPNFHTPVFDESEDYVLVKENENWKNFTRLVLSTGTTFTLFKIFKRRSV